MKIGIIGLGFVGGAVAYAHRNQELVIRDPKLGDRSASIEEIKICDAVYVCVPSPMLEDGHCDDSCMRAVLKELADYKNVIICKSTIPPGMYASLHEHYSNIVHAPEFLTAANANLDYVNATWMLVGGTENRVEEAIEVIKSGEVSATHYHKTNITTAALFKYIANSFLATKVIFMNEMYRLASQINVDWSEIKTIAKNDTRLGNSHWDVPGFDGKFGYGGGCFPKDVSAIIEHSIDIGTSLELLIYVKHLNEIHRKISL
jgi:UDPglucose 6-dehydrogenase